VLMKYSILSMLFVCVMVALPMLGKTMRRECTIVIEPKWQNLEHNYYYNTELFGGKWILAGSITFRKKSKDTIHLSKLIFRWKGTKLDNLLGSLYKKDLDKRFLPIEEFLISDSSWNRKKQMLVFNFKKQISLGPKNIFYLVLTVPEQIEPTLKQGSFVVESSGLPVAFKPITRHHSLNLAFSNLKPTSIGNLG